MIPAITQSLHHILQEQLDRVATDFWFIHGRAPQLRVICSDGAWHQIMQSADLEDIHLWDEGMNFNNVPITLYRSKRVFFIIQILSNKSVKNEH